MRIRAQWPFHGEVSFATRPAIIALLSTGAVAAPTPLASVTHPFGVRPLQENARSDIQLRGSQIPAPALSASQTVHVDGASNRGAEGTISLASAQPERVELAASTRTPDDSVSLSSASRTELPKTAADSAPAQMVAAVDDAKFSKRGLQTSPMDGIAQTSSLPRPEPRRTALSMPSAELKSMMRQVVSTRVGSARVGVKNLTATQAPVPAYKPVATVPIDVAPPSGEPVSGIAASTPKTPPVRAAGVTGSGSSGTEVSKYRSTARGIEFEVPLNLNGSQAGSVSLLIAGSDNISVQLGGLLVLLEPIMDAAEFERMSASQNADAYVTLNDLRAAGVAVSFDKHDRLHLEAS